MAQPPKTLIQEQVTQHPNVLSLTGGHWQSLVGEEGGAWYDAPPAVEIQNQGIQRRKGGAAEHSRINSGIPLCACVRSEGRTMPKLCTVVKVKS